jgi:hypothetical protein
VCNKWQIQNQNQVAEVKFIRYISKYILTWKGYNRKEYILDEQKTESELTNIFDLEEEMYLLR